MNILHIAKLTDDKANGLRTVVPFHIVEQAKHERALLQNVLNIPLKECEEYQVDFIKDGWPFNVQDKQGNSFSPDLVVFHGYYHFEMVGLAKTLCKNKIPYIVAPHGSLTRKAQATKRLKKIAGNFVFFDSFAKKAGAIQFLSQNEFNNSVKKNENNFISTNGMYMPSEQKEAFNEDKTVFSFIGRIDTHIKGLDLLVEAIHQKRELLRENGCVFRLIGPQTEEYQAKIKIVTDLIEKLEISDLVQLFDGVFGEEKKKKLLETDIFIQCSRTEAMPMGILEAMSYGVPCLITKGTSLTDLLDKYDAGWSCETTADAIADTIEKAVLERQLLNEKSKNAMTLIENNFLWENVAKNALENYKKFI